MGQIELDKLDIWASRPSYPQHIVFMNLVHRYILPFSSRRERYIGEQKANLSRFLALDRLAAGRNELKEIKKDQGINEKQSDPDPSEAAGYLKDFPRQK